MCLEFLPYDFTVCKTEQPVAAAGPFWFCAKTDSENSLVCVREFVPDRTLAREDGWKAFRICGKLDFSLVGILAKLTGILAQNGIAVFAVSTYDTDTVLVRKKDEDKTKKVLTAAGYTFCA